MDEYRIGGGGGGGLPVWGKEVGIKGSGYLDTKPLIAHVHGFIFFVVKFGGHPKNGRGGSVLTKRSPPPLHPPPQYPYSPCGITCTCLK